MIKDMLFFREKIKKIIEEAKKENIEIKLIEDYEGVGVYCHDLISNEMCKIKEIS